MTRLLCVLFLFLAACGSEVPAGNGDPIEVPKSCSSNDDCACPSGYGDAVCGADGLCYCQAVEVVQMGCQSESDCQPACGDCAGICQEATCYCYCSGGVVNTVIISTRNITGNPFIDQMGAEVGSFQISADGLSDIQMDQIALTQGGTLAGDKMANCHLFRGADEIASANFSGDRLVFSLATPYVIARGMTKSFYVHCDIVGGRMVDTIRLFLGLESDLSVVDLAQGQPANVVNLLTASHVSDLNLRGPVVTITDNGPASAFVLPGETGVEVLRFGVTSTHDVTVRDARVTVRVYDEAVALVGAANESAYSQLRNLRVVDLDTGSTLMGPLMTVDLAVRSELSGGVWYTMQFTEDYELTGGATRHLAILLDVDAGFPSGYSFAVEHGLNSETGIDSTVKYMPSNEMLPNSNIIGSPMASRRMIVTDSPGLNASRSAMPVSATAVKGATGLPVLGIELEAGTGDIMVQKQVVRFYANDSLSWASVVGDRAANTVVASAMLFDGSDIVDGPRSLTLVDASGDGNFQVGEYYKVLFDNLALTVPAGTTKTLTVKVTLLNTMSQTVYLAADVVPDWDIVAMDADANSVVPTGTSLNGVLPHDPVFIIIQRGTLPAGVEANPSSGIVIAGSTGVLVNHYRFDARDEDFVVDKLTIVNDPDGVFGDGVIGTEAVAQVTISYRDVNGVEQSRSSAMVNGTATFSNLGFYVPDDAFAWYRAGHLDIAVDVPTIAMVGLGLSGQAFRLGVMEVGNSPATYQATGVNSSMVDNTGDFFLSSNSGTFVVRKSVPTFAKAAGLTTSLITGENRLYGLTATADSAGPVDLEALVFQITAPDVTLANPKLYRGSTQVASASFSWSGDLLTVTLPLQETVAAGSSATYYLDAEVTGVNNNDSVSTRLVSILWSDGATSGIDEWGLGLEALSAHTLVY